MVCESVVVMDPGRVRGGEVELFDLATPRDRFSKDERGSLTIFSIFLFVLLLMICGMAVDLIRHEYNRVAIQQTADAAVLSSSRIELDTGDVEGIVREYFEKAGYAYAVPQGGIDVQGSGTDNARTVTVNVSGSTNTMFMNMMGIDELQFVDTSQGSQSAIDVEVSLVLDISSSMNGSSRLPRLKTAVENFATLVIPENPLASPSDVSINVVPYSLSVNPGAAIASYFNIEGKHNYRDCIWFETSDYDSLSITPRDPDPLATQRVYERYTHMADGSSGYYANGVVNLPMCPDHSIQPLLTERQEVIDAVNALTGWDGTGIDIGAKWGLALLDPEFREIVDGLITSSDVNARMAGRPFNYGESKKYLVIMSDGENDSQRDLHAHFREGPSLIWRDNTTGEYSVLAEDGRDGPGFDENNDTVSRWWHESSGNIRAYPDTSGASSATDWTMVENQMTNLTWPEVFNIVKTNQLYSRFFADIDNAGYLNGNEVNQYKQPINFNRINENNTNRRLKDICALATANDVTVYAISFDPPSSLAEQTLRDCVADAGNFFSVNGDQIQTAFSAIAGEITRIRLTQ